VRHYYRLPRLERPRRGRHQAVTVGYIHDLLGSDGARVVGYHWHPIEGGSIDSPHLHVGRQFAHPALPTVVRARTDRLVRSHLPTEPVVLPTVLRYAIVELGVAPLRDD